MPSCSSGMFQAPQCGAFIAHFARPPSTQFGASSFHMARVIAACSLNGGLPPSGGRYSRDMVTRVAVGTDGSATAAAAVKAAAEMARRFEAELILLGVFQDAAGGAGDGDPERQWASSPS